MVQLLLGVLAQQRPQYLEVVEHSKGLGFVMDLEELVAVSFSNSEALIRKPSPKGTPPPYCTPPAQL